MAPIAQLAKDGLSDAGGLRFESQTWLVTGESTRSLRRDKHPAIKGLRPPEHDAGHSIRTKKTTPPSQTQNTNEGDRGLLDRLTVATMELRSSVCSNMGSAFLYVAAPQS